MNATPSEPNRLDGGAAQRGEVVRYVPATGEGRVVVADLGDRHAKEILVVSEDALRAERLVHALAEVGVAFGVASILSLILPWIGVPTAMLCLLRFTIRFTRTAAGTVCAAATPSASIGICSPSISAAGPV